MPSPVILGTDVVDLTDPRCRGKASDRRFLRRVFTQPETAAILESPTPDLALWQRWAAKEAAFKAVSQLLSSPPPFEHARFQVTLEPVSGEGPSALSLTRGWVRYDDIRVVCACHQDADWVHAVAWQTGEGENAGEAPSIVTGLSPLEEGDPEGECGWEARLQPRFSDREWGCVHSRASAVTRLLARASLALTLGVGETRLEIACGPGNPGRRLPHVLLDGKKSGSSVSLSHHGKLAAWALGVSLISPDAAGTAGGVSREASTA